MNELSAYLRSQKPGTISDTETLEERLVGAWDDFEGSDVGGMAAYKLVGRMERVCWEPPELTFVIARHGPAKYGSTRAELQTWIVDIDKGIADISKIGWRKLTRQATR